MSKKLSLSIPQKMDSEVEELVKEGVFSTKTAVVEEGLRMVLMKYSGFRYDSFMESVAEKLRGGRRR